MRITRAMVEAMTAIADAEPVPLNGYDVMRVTDTSTAIYQLLPRLEGLGWISGEVTSIPHRSKAMCRFYKLTDNGRRQVAAFTGITWK